MSWIERFPGLAKLEKAVTSSLVEHSAIMSIAENTVIFGPGQQPDHHIMLLEGSVRVQQLSDEGREIVLYRIHAGESCVMTTACLLAQEEYSAQGYAENDVQAIAIPRRIFDQLLAQSDGFRQFVFHGYAKRITDLFLMIEEIAFQRVDVRLAHKLIELSSGQTLINITHQQLAIELGTAREVISRQLREFQHRSWVTQSRGSITLTDRESVTRLASN